MNAFRSRWRWLAAVALLASTACGKLPEGTEKARGLLAGQNVVLAMSVLFIVIAVGIIVGVIGLDRFMQSRARLAEEDEVVEEVEETDEVVGGITVGRAAVPRWLYGAYVLIPLFAFTYVASNVRPPAESKPKATAAAPSGPCDKCTISASQIKFTTDTLELKAAEVTVTFENKDTGVPHDFSVWKDKAAADAGGDAVASTGTVAGGASGEVKFDGGEVTYFNCTIHPTAMFGDIETG